MKLWRKGSKNLIEDEHGFQIARCYTAWQGDVKVHDQEEIRDKIIACVNAFEKAPDTFSSNSYAKEVHLSLFRAESRLAAAEAENARLREAAKKLYKAASYFDDGSWLSRANRAEIEKGAG